MSILAIFYWNFSKYWLVLNIFDFHFHFNWYGLLFSIGICVSILLGMRFLKNLFFQNSLKNDFSERSSFNKFLENFLLSLVLFLVIGARLGYVLFYGLPYYLKNPLAILKIWEGGLSSHGAILGFIFCAFYFSKRVKQYMPFFSFFCVTDIAAVTFGFAAFMIRIGNLFNQEIVGKPTNMIWGIVFSNPMDGPTGIPLHPVQIYEGFGYLIMFISFLIIFSRNKNLVGRGRLTALACIFISLIRFIAEFFKSHQGMFFSESTFLSMGQLLSIPLFLFGITIFAYEVLSSRKIEKTEL